MCGLHVFRGFRTTVRPYSTVNTNFQKIRIVRIGTNFEAVRFGHVLRGKYRKLNYVYTIESGHVFQGEIGSEIEEKLNSKGFGFLEENSISIVVV